MKSFNIITLGCKVNQYESRQIHDFLASAGLTPAQENADLVVVNSCCVTHTASAKSRNALRKAKKASPDAHLVLAGCLPMGPGEEFQTLLGDGLENLTIVEDKDDLAETLLQVLHIKASQPAVFGRLHAYHSQVRAFLKVQDGCDGYCSYCIIPSIRKTISSRNVSDILEEAQDLVRAGHKEIVLTGIFLGAWGKSTVRRQKWAKPDPDSPSLASLVAKLARIDGLLRLRLSSLEPGDLTDELIETMAKYPNVMPHLHLPLQSGSDTILQRMGRQYRTEEYFNAVKKLRAALDQPAVTTDMIAGFPTETDEDFVQTLNFAQSIEFSKIHVFSYSDRANTPANEFTPKVPATVIAERSNALQQLDAAGQKAFRAKFIGKEVSFLVESENPPSGRTERYFMASDPGAAGAKKGDLVTTILKK